MIVEQGQSESDNFTVSNPSSVSFPVYVSVGLGWISLETNNFILEPGQSEQFAITASPGLNINTGSYVDL